DDRQRNPNHLLGHVAVPDPVLNLDKELKSTISRWDILRRALDFAEDAPGSRSTALTPKSNRINVGSAIVLFGHNAVLNREWDRRSKTQDQEKIRRILERPP